MHDKEHLQVMINGTSTFAQNVMQENVNLKTHVHELVRQATQDAQDWFTQVLQCKNNQLLAAQVANIDKDVTMRKWDATHSFAMVKTNDGDAKLPSYAVRCKRRHMRQALKCLQRKHPNATVSYMQTSIPNAINFYQRLRDGGHIKTWHNYCEPDAGIVDFVQVIMDLNGGEAIKPSALWYENGREYLI